MSEQNFNKTWDELNSLNEDAQLQLIFDDDVKEVRKICKDLLYKGFISYIPNEKTIKMLIQMANIIKQENGRIPYSKFVPLAKGKSSDLIDLIFAVAIARHIPGKGQSRGEIRPFEDALIGWRALGKSREDEEIIAKALGFDRADYVETADYFSAGQGNAEPDLTDPTNGYTFDVKSFGNIDKVNAQKNRTALFILLTNPLNGSVSLYAKEPKEGEIGQNLPSTDYKLVDENNQELDNTIKEYLRELKNVKVTSREGSSYEKPSRDLDGEEFFTENNFKILDILLSCLDFTWPEEKK